MKNIRIALIEDDKNLLDVMRLLLTEKGHEVFCFEKAEDLLESYKSASPDVIITDKNLEGMDGFSLVKIIRSEDSAIPIFIISGAIDVESQLEAYTLGVDDFLKKPFNYDVLEAKFKRALKRSENQIKKRTKFTFDENRQMLVVDGEEISFTPGEIMILKNLVVDDNILITKELEEFQSIKTSFDVHVHSLRKKVLKIGWKIKNIRGKGYFLVID